MAINRLRCRGHKCTTRCTTSTSTRLRQIVGGRR